MRGLLLVLFAGCGFTQGSIGGGPIDGTVEVHDVRVRMDAAADTPPGCTPHTLPPDVNVDPLPFSASFLTSPNWDCHSAGTTTINSTAGTVVSTSCTLGAIDVTNNVAQTGGGPTVMVVRLRGLTITSSHVLRLLGDKPVVFLVAGDVVVDSGGMIDASAEAQIAGAGGSRAGECTAQASGLGMPPTGAGWGAGGGGFGTAGGQGCYNITNGGMATGSATLQPLRGGCTGGTSGGPGGAGGGAFQISASGTIAIGATGAANLVASGGGAPAAAGGGNGGGSGGAVLLVSPALATFGGSGALRANGGAGSEGCSTCTTNAAGTDGHKTDSTQATDTSGSPGGGNGNDNGRRGGLADIVGGGALVTAVGDMASPQVGGRGGGGGGGGRVHFTTAVTIPGCN